MPAYRDKLRPDEATALAIYVRAFVSRPHPEVLPAKTASATAKTTPASPPPTMPAEISPATPAPVNPAELYTSFCLACHDKDGRGGLVKAAMPKIPDFTDKTWQTKLTDNVIVEAIQKGSGKFMQPFKTKLNDQEAHALAAYIRSFSATTPGVAATTPTQPPIEAPKPAVPPVVQPSPADLAQLAPSTVPGKSLGPDASERITIAAIRYRQFCLACHGTDGRGTAVRQGMPTIPDFADAKWQASRSDAQLTVNIMEGYGQLMPPFRDRIDRMQAQALAAYVRAFGPRKASDAAGIDVGDLEQRMRQLQEQWRDLEQRIKSLPP
jgi:mono/diheme cytochrome c family protein